jgi:hypothetical protein
MPNAVNPAAPEAKEAYPPSRFGGDCDGKSPTYIKFDIEGVEAKALRGMKRNVAAFHPRLAVSVYHKPADLWEIPLLLNRMFPFYRLFLRHYTDSLLETVCYAI